MKKFEVFLAILCAFSLIISCVSINAVKIVKGEKGDAGRDGINGLNGTKGAMGLSGKDGKDGKDGIDGVDGKDGLTPYIKDDYWWIGDTNTGYLVTSVPCYIEIVTKSKVFGANELSEVDKFCYNNNSTAIKIKYQGYGSSSNPYWIIPKLINEGESYNSYYNQSTLVEIYNAQNEKIELISNSELEITYTIEEFLSLGTRLGGNLMTVTVIYTENQHIIQKVGE